MMTVLNEAAYFELCGFPCLWVAFCLGIDLAARNILKNNLGMNQGSHAFNIESVVRSKIALDYVFLFFVCHMAGVPFLGYAYNLTRFIFLLSWWFVTTPLKD